MPRSTQEIIDHADELARRFEDYEPHDDDARPAETAVLLRNAVVKRSRAEREVSDCVGYARKDGLSWAAIGAVLGTSGEAARQRYGAALTVGRK